MYISFFLLLCFDLWSFFASNNPAGFLVLSLFMVGLFARPFPWGHIIWGFLLLMSASLTMGLPLWWPLISVLPASIIISAIRPNIFPHQLYPALATGLCLIVDLLILRPFLLETTPSTPYTIGIIFGNILICMIFSLKLKTGKMGQSLTLA